MPVICEAISIVVRTESLRKTVKDGLEWIRRFAPDDTLCEDGDLLRVGFLNQFQAERFVDQLVELGLKFEWGERESVEPLDMAVVDMCHGVLTDAPWLTFHRVTTNDGYVISFVSHTPVLLGHTGYVRDGFNLHLVTPAGWQYQGSLSQVFSDMSDEPDDDADTQSVDSPPRDRSLGVGFFWDMVRGRSDFVSFEGMRTMELRSTSIQ
jgi:hypothetical protein